MHFVPANFGKTIFISCLSRVSFSVQRNGGEKLTYSYVKIGLSEVGHVMHGVR